MQEKKDIFDRIMGLGFLKVFEPFYKKHKEVLLYLFFGVLTTAVSFLTAGVAKFLLESAGLGKGTVSTASTVISWLFSVLFAYVTNRIWVFDSKASGISSIAREAAEFYGGRLLTLLVEMLIMWLGYYKLGINYWVTKIAANVVVIILNYIISKLVVFKTRNE